MGSAKNVIFFLLFEKRNKNFVARLQFLALNASLPKFSELAVNKLFKR
jgi:hypothetical protein